MGGLRVRRLRAELARAGLAAMVLTDHADLAWLTGFTGSSGAAVITSDTLTLVTDDRYTLQAGTQAPDISVVTDRHTAPAVAALLATVHPGAGSGADARVGVQTHVMTVDAHAELVAATAEQAPRVRVVPAGPVVGQLRRIKDDAELAALERACAVSVAALAALLGSGPLAGRTERAVVRELERLMVDAGADEVAFPTIVASGPHSASPHHEATGRPLTPGDLVVIDFGARVDGYCADMTRTVFLAPTPAPAPAGAPAGAGAGQPDGWQRAVYELVARANAAGRAAAVPGAGIAEVDAAARSIIEAAGHGEHFRHGLGHGIGLQVHEQPYLRSGVAGNLAVGEVVTVEPGVYLPGRGGVRIEDTVVVRDGTGGPRVLTPAPRELLVVP